MTMPSPGGGNRPRATRTIKLVLMGLAGAALLFSCTPGVGGGMGIWPWLWLMGNPFSRGPATVSAPNSTATPPSTAGQAQPGQRGGFGSTVGKYGSTTS